MGGGESLKLVQLLSMTYTVQEQGFLAAIASGCCPAAVPRSLLVLQVSIVLLVLLSFF